MGRKANPTWRHVAALRATHGFLTAAGQPLDPSGLLRPAASADQAAAFRRQTQQHADLLEWHDALAPIHAPLGGLCIRPGRAVDVGQVLRAAVRALSGLSVRADRLVGWRSERNGVCVQTSAGEVQADHLVVAAGADWTANAPADLLHSVKGQLALLDAPDALSAPVSGGVYLAQNGPHVVVGSTFEHRFADLSVSSAALVDLRRKAAALLPALAAAPIADGRAGIRVTTPGSRLPLAGPVTADRRVWCLTGLGAKGLLMAPLVAQLLAGALLDDQPLPAEIDAQNRLGLPSTYSWNAARAGQA
jgi:glycine/D-amino acid oxidase-like deaminating enzyme